MDIRRLAFQILEAHPHLTTPFNKEQSMAGKKLYYAFRRRHPNLKLRQAETIPIARSKEFNKENLYGFFDLLEKVVDEESIDTLRIFNMDESGFCTVQKKSPRVITQRGKHQVGFISSGKEVSTQLQFVAPACLGFLSRL